MKNRRDRDDRVTVEIFKDHAFIVGDTYLHKDVLTKHKFRWDPRNRRWHGHALQAHYVQDELAKRGVKVLS